MDRPKNQPKTIVSKIENAILKTSQEMAAAIMKNPEVNTYMPVSAGIESTAALIYAVRDPDLKPFCVHWYEQRYGLFADAMAFYTQKQAEYFNLPYGNDKSMLSMLPHTKRHRVFVSTNQSAFCANQAFTFLMLTLLVVRRVFKAKHVIQFTLQTACPLVTLLVLLS